MTNKETQDMTGTGRFIELPVKKKKMIQNQKDIGTG